ncbi:MAG: tail fiber domain-containing protein [Candidatus Contendobacter sp.]|nr:tail fiber domain-containing protein [Candidatus Contendobacter sp.]
MNEKRKAPEQKSAKNSYKKIPYASPKFIVYGSISQITQNGAGSGTDGGTTPGMTMMSDRLTKDNTVRIGTHPLGISLYLFDYKPEYRDAWGYGRQFGVMADEVEKVMPEALSVHLDGYKMVNYAMLGISRNLH